MSRTSIDYWRTRAILVYAWHLAKGLSGWLLLRFDERTLAALLLNDPPRNTRLLGLRPLESKLTKQ